jgi:eukaryotic-like serine/threonine-protein kinase
MTTSTKQNADKGSQDELLPRQFGKYTLLRALATGGMAAVYLALQRSVAGFEKLVVIKRVLPALASDAEFVEMLLQEARTAATLNHPNVVQTFDVGESEGTYYIAMEHINGEDIRSIVRGMRRKSVSAFPLEHTLSIVLGTCAGLAYAHERRDLEGKPLGIVHRDISPQNILITYSGDVKIVDFGIAKSTEQVKSQGSESGKLKGKVPYMSPEQARCEELDHRSDIFAVGILLFELTTGRRLFKAKSDFETLKLICEKAYPKPSQIRPNYPPELERIVVKALERDREDRYQSARDMQADLETFIRDRKIAASTVDLGRWMTFLFEEKIASQKEALQDVKQLADVIATQQTDGEMYGALSTGTRVTASVTGSGIQGLGEKRSRDRRQYMVFGLMATMLIVAGVIGLSIVGRPSGQPQSPAARKTGPEVAAAEKRGQVVVKTNPPGAYVRVAGELHGSRTPTTIKKLPLDMDLEVKVSKEGFEDLTKTVSLDEDALTRTLEFKLVRGSAVLEFEVTPATATVVLDKVRWTGKGTKVTELAAGDHVVVFAAPDHVSQTVRWKAEKGSTKKVQIVLRKAGAGGAQKTAAGTKEPAAPPKPQGRGTVRISSTGGYCASTIVNGRNVGPTPVAGVSVKAGPVSVLCRTSDGRTVGSGGRVTANKSARITVRIPAAK